ncbi:MAG: protein meaA [Myxococcales bacterium]|nr:protein meaA [Myxococcales bacterium]
MTPLPATLSKPAWIVRTYAGFGDAVATNRRFRDNLARGQTGLSVAFDLPTQCGYDPDDPLALPEVGRAGVSVAHLGDMAALFDGIDLATANTSMTINATAPWLYALYLALADRQGVARERLRGTTQNDLLKEFVARGTYIFDPAMSLRLQADLVVTSAQWTPRWNPMNACGYHLMESGAGPVDEVGWALGGALLLLDTVRPRLDGATFARVVDTVSFFINSGLELVPEICKVRAYARLWPALCQERYGCTPRFRAGCQVRSLTLAAQQPELNIVRIALQALPAVLSASARVGALQLPGFREALALPDAAEQTLALRTQQVLLHETGIADWPDIFAGSHVIEAETARIEAAARQIALRVPAMGYGRAIEELATTLAQRMAQWRTGVETGTRPWVGVNCFEDVVPFLGLATGPGDGTGSDPDDGAAGQRRAADLHDWRMARDAATWEHAKSGLAEAARAGTSVLAASVAFAAAGGTTGEWTHVLLASAGPRWRAPLGVDGLARSPTARGAGGPAMPQPRRRIVLAKAGLDGHINALRLLALGLRDAGAEVVWLGPGTTPADVAATAIAEAVDAIGLSSLSGAHLAFAAATLAELAARGGTDIAVIVGGTIPAADRARLLALGVTCVVTVEDGGLDQAIAVLLTASVARAAATPVAVADAD